MVGIVIGVAGMTITILFAGAQVVQARRAAQAAEVFADEARNTLRIIVRSLEQAGMAEVHWEGDLPAGMVMHYRLEAEPGRYELKGSDAGLRVTRADGSEETR